jgi:hypothetical protein
MKRKCRLLLRCLGIVGIVLVGVMALSAGRANAAGHGHPDALTHASPEQVGKIALAEARRDFVVRGGVPRVVLARRVARDDLPKLALPPIPKTTFEDPPLTLVIIKGDFGAWLGPSIVHDGPPEHFAYVGYVYDLWAGSPELSMASPDGGQFRTALADPSLPIIPTPAAIPFTGPVAPLHHYGDTVLPIATVAGR